MIIKDITKAFNEVKEKKQQIEEILENTISNVLDKYSPIPCAKGIRSNICE